jgi:nitrous oxidase accessory protein
LSGKVAWIPAFAGMTGEVGGCGAGVTALLLFLSFPAHAATLPATPATFPAALARAAPGDVLVLGPGRYAGPLVLDKPVTLRGLPGAVVDGGGSGNTITVNAADVTVRGLIIRHSGHSLEKMNAGVFLNRTAHRARVEYNLIQANLVGVYVWGPRDALVAHNRIEGLTTLRVNERGNGVSLWHSPGSRIIGNRIRFGRDGIFTTTSSRNVFARNRMQQVRFAVHYMYTNDSLVAANTSIGNDVGYALMYSNGIQVVDNVSRHDRDHGILMNYANLAGISGNSVEGGDKCVFIYNSNKSLFIDNRFQGCAIGIHFTAGSERNTFHRNAFIANANQVKYVGTRSLDWASGGVGNYWSDNVAFDLDGDGIADMPYRPNDVVDQVIWRAPSAKLLLNSPAVQLVRWAQSQFPAMLPGGVVDTAPLMAPPPRSDTRP